VFGHIGYNEMREYWMSFREHVPVWTDIADPFDELAGSQHEYRPGQWIQFVAEQRNGGMTDERLTELLDDIFHVAEQKKLKMVVTNGIADVDHGSNTEANRLSDDRRTQFLNQVIVEKEQTGNFEVTLINLNDVFVRNFP